MRIVAVTGQRMEDAHLQCVSGSCEVGFPRRLLSRFLSTGHQCSNKFNLFGCFQHGIQIGICKVYHAQILDALVFQLGVEALRILLPAPRRLAVCRAVDASVHMRGVPRFRRKSSSPNCLTNMMSRVRLHRTMLQGVQVVFAGVLSLRYHLRSRYCNR